MTRPGRGRERAQAIEVEIERPVAGGRMLGRMGGRVVLVSGTIPGERVIAHVERETKHVVFARTVDVLRASPDRRPVEGDPACGGLTMAHIAYPRQTALKADVVVDAFRRIAKIPCAVPEIVPSPERGYRMRARFHVERGHAGFFREGSNVLCDAGPTRQLSSGTLDAVHALAAHATSIGMDAETIVVSETVDGRGRLALLETRTPRGAAMGEQLLSVPGWSGVKAQCGECGHGPWGAERIFDGAEAFGIADIVPLEVRWGRSAGSFFQGNRYLVGALVREVLTQVAGEDLLDLYAGVGLFAVPLAARGARVLAIENDIAAGVDLAANAEGWPGLMVRQAAVERGVTMRPAGQTSTVVLDPPRIGVSPEAMTGIIGLAAPRIVYVSCDVATLARDVAKLAAAGYSLRTLRAFDMFPSTAHIETVAVLER